MGRVHREAFSGRLFDQYMDEITATVAPAVAAAYDFGTARTVVDIAGGRGVLLAEILRRNASARGILFNLSQVIEAARGFLDSEIAQRIEFVSGNFFQEVPAGGDVYILKNILHDWNDDAARLILATCRRAISAEARLLIVEHIIGPANEGSASKVGDVQMMVRTGGRNRTEQEFYALLNSSGFQLTRITQTAAGPALIEAMTEN